MQPAKLLKTRIRRKRQTTLSDIAKLAGVAPMTVSRVVNGNGYVGQEMRRKIEKVIADLQYSPNRLTRSLKGTAINVIGVLLPDLANPFSAALARGIEDALAARAYYAFVITADRNSQREDAAIQAFSDHRVGGVVLATRCSALDPTALGALARDRFPVVVVGPDFTGDYINHVTARYRDGGFQAAEHLIRLGRRRIAWVGSGADDSWPLLRFRGYVDALERHGLRVDPELAVGPARRVTWCTQLDGYQCMSRLLDLPNPPDAVFARNDFAAFGALHAMHERGVKVPDDIAIVGFDNVSMAAYAAPPLTTVNQFAFEQGKAAGNMVLDKIEVPDLPSREEQFPCELVIRQSSGVEAAAQYGD